MIINVLNRIQTPVYSMTVFLFNPFRHSSLPPDLVCFAVSCTEMTLLMIFPGRTASQQHDVSVAMRAMAQHKLCRFSEHLQDGDIRYTTAV